MIPLKIPPKSELSRIFRLEKLVNDNIIDAILIMTEDRFSTIPTQIQIRSGCKQSRCSLSEARNRFATQVNKVGD